MPQTSKRSTSEAPKTLAKSAAKSRVLGAKAFAAITAVEGLRLNTASRRRLAQLQAKGLTADERRAEVLQAYIGLGRKG